MWSWGLIKSKLPEPIRTILLSETTVRVSAVSFYEIRQKVRIGKWPEMEPHADKLSELLASQGAVVVPVSAEIADLAGALEWLDRDPFDRIIAATSIVMECPLLSADGAFDQLSDRKDWPGRVW